MPFQLRRRRERPRLRRAHAGEQPDRRQAGRVCQRLADAVDACRARRPRRRGRALLDAGADVNAVAGDGKTALAVAIFNGNYDVASLLVDRKADVNKADAQRFTPLFWAVDRRNMETAPNFPWMVTADPMPLIRKLLDAGANPTRSSTTRRARACAKARRASSLPPR
jgi:ankyrin repeat protein